MTNIEFWTLINESCKFAKMDNDKYLKILNKRLLELDDNERYQFNYYVGYYAGKAAANPKLALLMKVIGGSVTDDSLLYFAIWIVSRGEDIYFETLKNPDKFITLVNVENFPRFDGHYYTPEFELLMYAGRNEEEYGISGEISEEEYNLISKIYNEKIPMDERNYYDLIRDIDEILPETINFFEFDKKKLEESLEYEEMENDYSLKIKNEEKKLINQLKKQQTFVELEKTVYDIERPKRNVPIAISMPPYNESIIMYTTGLNENKDGFIIKKCYWHNYKTGENKEIKNTGTGEYLTRDDENIYFYRGNLEGSPKIFIYNFESNTFSSVEIDDEEVDNNIIANVIFMIGNGENKSGVIHNGKLYFSLTLHESHHTFKFLKEKSYTYDITTKQVFVLGENISNIGFYQNKMYYLELGDHSDDNTYYQSPKNLICRDLKNDKEVKIAENVSNYAIDNGIIYYSAQKKDRIHDLIRLENENSSIILKDQRYLNNFTVAGHNLFLSFYVSLENGGSCRSFILNMKTGTICEVPNGNQMHEAIIYENKYIAIESIYDNRKVFLRIFEYELG
ncbi:MAG: DUF4240 domain-containing protein [Sebaldella sp.]|nr:DUF4240 domain-containing protein [Sebaldella sp.]